MKRHKVLVLGASGMLGHAVFAAMASRPHLECFGTVRERAEWSDYYTAGQLSRLVGGVRAEEPESLKRIIGKIRPDTVINCIGLIKQLDESNNPVKAITVNALLPHLLSEYCGELGARLVQISTDCVFSGKHGNYAETDPADAVDLYGRTKLLGEVADRRAVTLRTSIIGHELRSRGGLLEWFLAQSGTVKGYTDAVFSGLTTMELARVIMEYIIPDESLRGIYHVSTHPIAKHDLLQMIKRQYGKSIRIVPDSELKLDRSLRSGLFRARTGYRPPAWEEQLESMHAHYMGSTHYRRGDRRQ